MSGATLAAGELPIAAMPGHRVRRLHQVAVALFAEEFGEAGITPVQFAALVAVGHRPGLDQAGLAAAIGYDRATIGGVVERLEAKGWLARRSDPADRRVRRLSTTAAGRAVLARAMPAAERVQRRLLEPLTETERRSFGRIAAKLLAHHRG